ncbi:hypothetical protein BV25DRAFT_1913714 [Artomyces pyxidatus]|uniref:Uncharacterized protein n=1 Tax=Artomyces pyxidatus TaxID=48021 RepID=A0ACB8T9U6_9AGAM|nr:hypothetical protein BV25DRAFT_1913714 [Artomyces pyxidatus]
MAYYGPDESASEIFLERTFLSGDVISGTGYGIQLVMYTSCVLYLWQQRKARSHFTFLLAYITLLFILETIYIAVQARTVQIVYIDNRNYPGGPWAYFLASQSLAVNVMFYATLFVITFLSDALVLWRCWVIWGASGQNIAYLVTAFPALMLVASFVMGVLWTLQSSQPGLSLYSALPLAYGTSYYAISLGVNIILTILITIRLLQYRQTVLKTLPPDHAKHYVSLMTVLVESAALYSLFAVLFLITYAINNPLNQVFLGIAQSCQQIALYLIIYRLADGRAWKKSTLTTNQALTTIIFEGPHDATRIVSHADNAGDPYRASMAGNKKPEAESTTVFAVEKADAESLNSGHDQSDPV